MDKHQPEFSFKSLFVPFTTLKAIHWIVVIGLIVFSNSIFNGFVRDDAQVTDNTLIHSFNTLGSVFTGSTFYNAGLQGLQGSYYKPLMSLIFGLLYIVFPQQAYAFHLFQLLIHIANTVILFLILKYFFKKPIAFILSLIFLIHPLNSEAVFYISALQDVLFFFFGILFLFILQKQPSLKILIFSSILLLCSLLSKETGVLFLLVALIYVFFFQRKQFSQMLVLVSSVFCIYFLMRIFAIGILPKISYVPIAISPALYRFYSMPEIIFFYLKQFFFPLNLASSYNWVYHQITFVHFFLPIILDLLFFSLLGLLGYFIYIKNRKYFSYYVFFFLWFGFGLLLHLQIFPLDATVAERWFYFPMVGLLGIIGIVLETVKINVKNKWVIACITVILLLLATRTFQRSFDWRNDTTLSLHDVEVSRHDFVSEKGASVALMNQGHLQQAKVYAQKSIQDFPYHLNYDVLGLIYLNMGDYALAKKAYMQSLKIGDEYSAYEFLGGLALVYGKTDDNISFLNNAVKKYPQGSRLWFYLAILEYKEQRIDDAKSAITHALYFDPSSSDNQYVYQKIMNNQPLNLNFNTGEN